MNLGELIDRAAEAAGGKGKLAAELGEQRQRMSEWRNGIRRPDATEIVYMARRAGLPEAETLAQIEEQLDPRFPGLWSGLLGKLKAAGVAASVAFVAYLLPTQDAKAGQFDSLKICAIGTLASARQNRSRNANMLRSSGPCMRARAPGHQFPGLRPFIAAPSASATARWPRRNARSIAR